jgi:hypothetical protein
MLHVTLSPSLRDVRQFVKEALYTDINKHFKHRKPDEVVIFKNVRYAWKKRYDDNDLVKIVTANDGQVCKFCIDMVQHNPYRYGDAKKMLPHHPKCRCQIRSLRATDPGYLMQPTVKKARAYAKVWLKRHLNKGKTPQRGATIKRLRKKKGSRVVAPSGYRALRIRTSRGS